MTPRFVIAWWIVVSILVLAGSVVSWVQLTFLSRETVSKYLARVRLACASVSVILLMSTSGIVNAAQLSPLVALYSLLSVTYLAFALWSWIFYTMGYLNGGGWIGVVKQLVHPKRRTRMDKPREEGENESRPDNPQRPPVPQPSGVVDGPGKSEDNPPSEPPPDHP